MMRASTKPIIPYSAFLVANSLACVFVYPIVCVVATLVFWHNDGGLAVVVGATSALHLITLWVGVILYRRTQDFARPMLLATAFVFLYNRRDIGEPDPSPFSSGVTTVDQHSWGFIPYYRIFDQPLADFGTSHLDWSAVFIAVELSVFLAVILELVGELVSTPLLEWIDKRSAA